MPLSPEEFEKPLGPGYGLSGIWYAGGLISGRVDNCVISTDPQVNNSVPRMKDTEREVRERMMQKPTYESFGTTVQSSFHSMGHLAIGGQCGINNNVTNMQYSEFSARDPIFWRWHKYLEDIMREHRDHSFRKYEFVLEKFG